MQLELTGAFYLLLESRFRISDGTIGLSIIEPFSFTRSSIQDLIKSGVINTQSKLYRVQVAALIALFGAYSIHYGDTGNDYATEIRKAFESNNNLLDNVVALQSRFDLLAKHSNYLGETISELNKLYGEISEHLGMEDKKLEAKLKVVEANIDSLEKEIEAKKGQTDAKGLLEKKTKDLERAKNTKSSTDKNLVVLRKAKANFELVSTKLTELTKLLNAIKDFAVENSSLSDVVEYIDTKKKELDSKRERGQVEVSRALIRGEIESVLTKEEDRLKEFLNTLYIVI